MKKAKSKNLLLIEEPNPHWDHIFRQDCKDKAKLKKILQQNLISQNRQISDSFVPKIIVLVEGATEQILLPCLAEYLDIDLLNQGVIIICANGAKKIVRKYLSWKDAINLPIFCIFDLDAQDLAQTVRSNLRHGDFVYVLSDGEIEDLMGLEFLVDKLNKFFEHNPLYDQTKPVCCADFANGERRTLVLEKIWREKELTKFEKVKLAQFIAGQKLIGQKGSDFISEDGKLLFQAISNAVAVISNEREKL